MNLYGKNHFVRIVGKTVDEIRIEEVIKKNTKEDGAGQRIKSYNIAASSDLLLHEGNLFFKKDIKQCNGNVNSYVAYSKPVIGFRTINALRREKLKETADELFTAVVKLLNRKRYIQLKNFFIDKTKIEEEKSDCKKTSESCKEDGK